MTSMYLLCGSNNDPSDSTIDIFGLFSNKSEIYKLFEDFNSFSILFNKIEELTVPSYGISMIIPVSGIHKYCLENISDVLNGGEIRLQLFWLDKDRNRPKELLQDSDEDDFYTLFLKEFEVDKLK